MQQTLERSKFGRKLLQSWAKQRNILSFLWPVVD
jgi:hypothetical protein